MYNTNLIKGLFTVLCVTGFAVIAYFVTQGALPAFDSAVQQEIFSMRTDALSSLLIPLTYSGNWQVVTTLCAALLIIPQTRLRYGLPLALSALLSVGFYEMLKFIFQRPRPDAYLRLISESGFSFPSGHSLTSLVVWGTAIMLIRYYSRLPRSPYSEEYDFPRVTGRTAVNLLTVLFTAYIILMGFSRVYVGVHYPTDIIGAWCLGGCMLIALHSTFFPTAPSKYDRT